ncbi:MAG: SDR family NAD(P)-dependent oxidoreductase [Oceanicaulis sp.]
MSVSLSSLPDGYRALVFGATGGIGSALCQKLSEDPRCGALYAASRRGDAVAGAPGLAFSLEEPDSISAAVAAAAEGSGLHLVIAATGALHGEAGLEPEKSWRHLDANRLAEAFRVNTILPALIAREALDALDAGSRAAPKKAVFAALSARVGSISDNRLGGWHGYRASKAALNQILRTVSVELERKKPGAICAGLHPGTVDTGLSEPFQRNVPEGKLFTPDFSARRLLSVIDALAPEQSGKCFDWAGEEITP